MRASVFNSNKNFLPLNFNLESAYAENAVMKIAKVTPINVIKMLLTKYLENGTPDEDTILESSVKLSKVGLVTKNFGGYAKSSL